MNLVLISRLMLFPVELAYKINYTELHIYEVILPFYCKCIDIYTTKRLEGDVIRDLTGVRFMSDKNCI